MPMLVVRIVLPLLIVVTRSRLVVLVSFLPLFFDFDDDADAADADVDVVLVPPLSPVTPGSTANPLDATGALCLKVCPPCNPYRCEAALGA